VTVAGIIRKGRRLAAENSKWHVYLDHIVDERGNEVPDFLVIEGRHAGAERVTGVAVLAEYLGHFLLLRSYRHAIGMQIWDIPHGFIDADEEPQQAVLRELAEETGLTCHAENLIPLGHYAPDPSTMAARAALFAALGCTGNLRKARDELGLEELQLIGPERMIEMAEIGEIEDAATLIAIYRYRDWRARNGHG